MKENPAKFGSIFHKEKYVPRIMSWSLSYGLKLPFNHYNKTRLLRQNVKEKITEVHSSRGLQFMITSMEKMVYADMHGTGALAEHLFLDPYLQGRGN